MREIKFRVWNAGVKGYLTLRGEQFVYKPLNEEHLKLMFDSIKYLTFGHSNILEQYTGLNDKDDKEIYEGDIIKYQDRDYSEFFGQGDVYYDGDDCMFKIRCNNVILFFMNLLGEELEVIGNIHDNEKNKWIN